MADVWDPADDYATMGHEDFQTVGAYDQYGNDLGAVSVRRPGGAPSSTANRRGRAVTAPSGGGARYPLAQRGGMGPAGRGVVYPAGGVDEPRVVQIVSEELARRLPQWFQGASRVPGSSDQAQLMSPLGLGVGALTNAVNVVTLSAQPQRPFRGERLIIDLARSAGALTVPVRITEFKIGENSQLVGAGALPADAFAPDAFGVRLAMSPSAPGIVINLRIETDVAAVPAGESISVTAAIIGRAVWGESGGPG